MNKSNWTTISIVKLLALGGGYLFDDKGNTTNKQAVSPITTKSGVDQSNVKINPSVLANLNSSQQNIANSANQESHDDNANQIQSATINDTLTKPKKVTDNAYTINQHQSLATSSNAILKQSSQTSTTSNIATNSKLESKAKAILNNTNNSQQYRPTHKSNTIKLTFKQRAIKLRHLDERIAKNNQEIQQLKAKINTHKQNINIYRRNINNTH